MPRFPILSIALVTAAVATGCADTSSSDAPACSPISGPNPGRGHQMVSAGATYSATFSGGDRKCQAAYSCGPTFYYPWVTTCYREEPCPPSVEVVGGPPGAVGTTARSQWLGSVEWTVPSGFAPSQVEFEVLATGGPECPPESFHWSVTVVAAPAVTRLDAPADVRVGEPFTITATIDGELTGYGMTGSASWELQRRTGEVVAQGPIESGVGVQSALSSAFEGELVVTVEDIWGSVATARRPLRAWAGPPTISGISTTPAIVVAGSSAALSWSTQEASTVYIYPPIAPPPLQPSGRATFAPPRTTTYLLTASNPVWGATTSEATVTVVPRARIDALLADPPEVPFLGQATVTPVFEGYRASLWIVGGDTVDVVSGEAIPLPPLEDDAYLRLTVTNPDGSSVELDRIVPVVGPGTFTSAEPIGAHSSNYSRSIAALPGGRLLVIRDYGAQVMEVATREAEPVFPLAEPMRVARSLGIGDGRVLVAGTATTGPSLQILDPAARTARVLQSGIGAGEIIPLPDGRAIALTATSYLRFDPASDRLDEIPRGEVDGFEGCVLADGRVLVLGAAWWVLDPVSLAPVATGSLGEGGSAGDVACLPGGGAVFARVTTLFDAATVSIRRIDTATPAAVEIATLYASLERVVAMSDGRVLLLGKWRAWELDPATGSVAARGFYRSSVGYLGSPVSAALLDDGRIAVAGTSSLELYEPWREE